MTAEKCYLVREEHIPESAACPVIDAHNHLWADWKSLPGIVEVMDRVGVVSYCDLTANVSIAWVEGGYEVRSGDIEDFFSNAAEAHPGRFYGFTTATLAQAGDRPLFADAGKFVERTVAVLRDHVARGARGLKVLKELGLRYRDAKGNLIEIDDPALSPIWEEASRLGVPVLMHQSDPVGFFEPVAPENEHYDSLQKYPSWSFADAEKFPRKAEIIERRDHLIAEHPDTTFLLPHVANYAEDLAYVGRLLDLYPNVFIDFSARCDELGRQPYTAREFLMHYQDRIYFGTDMPASEAMYRFYFRFLETKDEYFVPPDYDGTFGRYRWKVHGMGLPAEVLEKIYYRNALKLIPGLDADMTTLKGNAP